MNHFSPIAVSTPETGPSSQLGVELPTKRRNVIPLIDHRQRRLPLVTAPPASLPWISIAQEGLPDTLGRPLRDLRISVTDRCNLRCTYCMPRKKFGRGHVFLPPTSHLSFEEITRLTAQFAALGVRKVRLTGGEPLLRKNLAQLIEQLSHLRTLDGRPLDLTLTTNGSLLERQAQALKQAGLRRITVSLDALDDAIFGRINDVGFKASSVLRGIDAAHQAGLTPIKINMVVMQGVNDSQIIPMARHFRGTGAQLRFIEYMDVGNNQAWRMDQMLPSSDVLSRLQAVYPLHLVARQAPGETATRWHYSDGQGEIGLISSVSHAFCGDCNRARVSADGQLFTCLFAHQGHDLRALLRSPHSDDVIRSGIASVWTQRQDRYSEQRGEVPSRSVNAPRVEMHYVGG